GAVQSLTDSNLTIGRGEVVGLVRDNGAGKSTLVKIITAGPQGADDGELLMDGRTQRFSSPKDAQKAGVATVFQDLSLCENLDVVANLFLGHEDTRAGVLDEVAMEAK
ncbi:sugar ABC transporter ATP-binding protein, partial [Burkholderia multivorans]